MNFEVVVENFGSKLQPYSNNPDTDVQAILGRIKELKSSGTTRHVVFVGEAHDNKYDTSRRAKLIDAIRNQGQELFPEGPPKIVSERFGDVVSEHVHMKEPDLADDLPEKFRTLHKHTNGATGELTESEKLRKLSGPASQSRNQWFAYAIMKTINDTWSKPVPLVVVCGDDHAPFVSDALADLVKAGYPSEAEVVWHHFPSAPDTVQPMNQVQDHFNFDLQGKTPVGFIRNRINDERLILLANGNLQKNFTVEVVAPYGLEGAGWALFFGDTLDETLVRTIIKTHGQRQVTLSTSKPARVQKLSGPEDITQAWSEAFD